MLVENKEAVNTIYNVAFGERTTLMDLTISIKSHLSQYDPKIKNIPVTYGEERLGDIPHSLASIEKAQKLIRYNPRTSLDKGLKITIPWYCKNLSPVINS